MEYLLDTSVILGYLFDEPQTRRLDQLKATSGIPLTVLTELYGTLWKRLGRKEADRIYGEVKAWHLPVLIPDETLAELAAYFHAHFRLGLGDAFVAAFAKRTGLTLVTLDRDFTALRGDIKLLYWR